jgi:UDP-glucose 4,6-dehydratase
MNILVTGGCGFIGSAFCKHMIENHSFTIVNLDFLYPCSTSELTTSHGNYHFIHGDIKNKKLITRILTEYNINIVIHFAAQTHVDTSFTNPMMYTHDNVVGTHTLLEACRLYGKLEKFIQISTDEVYGENSDNAFTETSLLKPTNPYAASKASAEMFVNSYIHSYNFPAIIIRSNNIYGPGQFHEKVIPKFMFQLLDDKKITIQGSGDQLRSFLYIDDAVSAILCVMFNGKLGEIYNISSSDEITIYDLATRMISIVKGEDSSKWITYVEDRNFNDKRYWIKSEPLFQLGWKQTYSLNVGLPKTIEWFNQVDREKYWKQTKVVLLWGGRGWIGTQFKHILQEKGWIVLEAKSRADNKSEAMMELENSNATHVACLIGRTHGEGFSTIDYLEQPGKLKENMNDNLYAPLVLADLAKERGLHMLYMGTGCIFEYDNNHPTFHEDDKPNFFGSSYSIVKGFTDQIMSNYPNVLNVRIRMPISSVAGPRNFISKIISYPKICSIPNSMTVLDDILPLLADYMNDEIVGTLNAVNPGVIDHSTILNWYKELQNPDHTWEEVETLQLGSGRSNNELDTTRIQSLSAIPHIQDSVRRILENNKF